MSLQAGDLLLVEGFPSVAVVLAEGEVVWHAVDGIRSGNLQEFLGGRSPEVLRLPDPLKRTADGSFPPSVDPRHTSIEERELVAFLLSGQTADLEEVVPWILKAARVQIGHDFLTAEASESEREAASVLFALNSLRTAECVHGVLPRAGMGIDDLRNGNFLRPAP